MIYIPFCLMDIISVALARWDCDCEMDFEFHWRFQRAWGLSRRMQMQIASSRYAAMGISSMHSCLTLELVQSVVSKEQRNKYEASNPSGECTYKHTYIQTYIHKIIMRSAIFCIFVCESVLVFFFFLLYSFGFSSVSLTHSSHSNCAANL